MTEGEGRRPDRRRHHRGFQRWSVARLHGALIGVTTAVGVSSIGVEGIGFAIPVETVTRITGELIATGTATHPGIGITASETPGDTADGGMRVVGLTIEVVSASSPAEAARLRAGDMITAIDDIEVSSMTDLTAVIAVRSVGDTVTLSVVGADGTSSEVTVTLADRPAA